MSTAALDLLASLVLEDGRRWGDAAVPEQWEDARAVLDPEAPPYHFLTRARGYSKTGDLAGIAVASMLAQLPAGSRLYGLASDRDQGRLLTDSIAGFVARTPELRGALTVDAYKVTSASGSVLEILAADAASAFGLRPAFLIVDELAQWASTAAPRALWAATTSALTKVPGARMAVLTSAGDPAHWSHAILEHAQADPLWRVNQVSGPPPWADRARLEEQRRRLPASSYARLFLNQWTSAEDRLTALDDLRACVSLPGSLPPLPGLQYRIGVDLGLKRDRTVAAIVHCERVPAGGVRVVLDRMQVWAGKRLHPVKLGDVEAWLLEHSKLYGGARVTIDPYQAVSMAQRLRVGGVHVQEFAFTQQSVGRLAINLHTAIRDRRLALPDDTELIDELANVRLRETSPGVLRMDHDADKHDDRAIALALAGHGFWERGVGSAGWLEVWEREAEAAPKLSRVDRLEAARLPKHTGEHDRAAPRPGCQHRWQRWPGGECCCVLCGGWRGRGGGDV